MKKLIVITLFAMMATFKLSAQLVSPVKWSFASKKGPAGTATIYLKATIEQPWHIYSVNQGPGGPQKTAFTFEKSAGYTLVGKVTEPKPIVKYESVFGINVSYFENSVVFSQKIKLRAGGTVVRGKVAFMACNESSCLPADELAFSIPVSSNPIQLAKDILARCDGQMS